MKFEVLKKSHLKRNIIIGVIAISIISAIILNFTRAKYKVTQSIPLVNGTINYSLADFNAVALYIESDSGYEKSDTIPESGYVFNEEESYCTVNNERDDNISLSYDIDTKTLNLKPMTAKGTKCYLYFSKNKGNTMTEIIAGYNKSTRNDFNSPFSENTTKTVYTTTDWKGTSYYFAGQPTDNWVYFGGFYWRIIRVNGDGSTRLIYNGTNTSTTGAGTLINNGIGQAFNTNYNASYYVGLSYSTTQHGTGTKSDMLKVLDNWYNSSNLDNYASNIDSNIGFCSDRNMASGYSWVAIPSSAMYYAAYDRLEKNQNNVNPSLNCNNKDILQISIGLITFDEIFYAGYSLNGGNQNYYLYNAQIYYTMTPKSFEYRARLYCIYYGGTGDSPVTNEIGVRPVINLKADTKFVGSGTTSDPFTAV